ncbi:MAG: hypothetical protein IKV75_04580 [Bacteroidales bacterium]|nr:hypothetical protein [Bacteroidales bacterium]
MRKYIIILFSLFVTVVASAQDFDTTGIYGERADSLDAAVYVSRQSGNYLS